VENPAHLRLERLPCSMRLRSGKQRSSAHIPSMGGELTAVCEVCGNECDKAFEVRAGEATLVFNSFECAIHAQRDR
jgi:hypothetical protein